MDIKGSCSGHSSQQGTTPQSFGVGNGERVLSGGWRRGSGLWFSRE